jgi:two-component system, OmpR family, response regulator
MRVTDRPSLGTLTHHPRVLVIDAERSVADCLAAVLADDEWRVSGVSDGRSALARLRSDPPDVVVLDVVLPDMDGLTVLQTIRRERPALPVLCLSSRADVDDRIAALSYGGDDYVAKPFSVEEVGLRVRGLLRQTRAHLESESECIVVGDLVLDVGAHEVTRGGEPLYLTATEFALLLHMARNAGTVLSKSHLLRTVWSSDFGRDLNVVEVYVGYLRRKIDCGRTPLIHTLRGVGYVLRQCPAATAHRRSAATA